MFRLELYNFCRLEEDRLSYRLACPLVHNRLRYDLLVYDPVCDEPVIKDSEDGWIAGLSCLSEEECRDILLQVCHERVDRIASNKQTIIGRVGIGAYAEEMRRLQDCIEKATVYV